MLKIVVDIYGADVGTDPLISGVAKAINKNIDFFPVMVGDASLIREGFIKHGISEDRFEIINTDKFITNNDPPTSVFRGCDDTSLVMAYKRLKNDNECVALLSAGSTGAMLVGSVCRLGLLTGLKFPVLCSALPCAGDNLITLVDCGANVDCSANDLVHFAKMGDVFSRCYCNIQNPRIGLMSVGREAQKGNKLTREAFEKLSELPINFIGNLEGSDMVSGYADVIVTDGFSGNILLKNTEAVGKAATEIVESIGAEVAPELVEKIKSALYKKFDFNNQGAATFLGTEKIVVKMHGCANEDTTVASIEQIIRLEKADFSKALKEAMAK